MPKQKMVLATALAVGLLGGMAVNAKGTVSSPQQVLAQTNITGTPLIINVGDDNSFQVFNTNIGGGTVGQIFPSSQTTLADMGWFVRVGNALTAPSFNDHGGTATGQIGVNTPYGARTVSAVSGTGTAASPFSVTVQGTAGGGLLTTQTVTYVNGDNFFRKSFQLNNPGVAAVSARIFLASDIFLASSDQGTPLRISGAPGGQTCAGIAPVFTILHIPQGATASTGFSADGYSSIWTQVGAGALNNTVNPTVCIDNGAGLQWDVTVPPAGSSTVQAATSFGDVPGIVQAPVLTPVPIGNAWTLALMALLLSAIGAMRFARVN